MNADKIINYLQAKNIQLGYGRKIVVSDLEFELHRGEILTLIGPNGAGKSTILKNIIGQLPCKKGTLLLEGKDVFHLPAGELAKKMSILMTDKVRPELMTCRQVVETGRYPYTGALGILRPVDQQAVEEALNLVHGQDLAERDFLELSDGQMQKILLARCICQEPEIIVLDEPTSYLDIRHKLELLTLLKSLVASKNITVIMSLHEIELAQRISDRILCIKDGKIDRMGAPEEIFVDDYIPSLYGLTKGSYEANYGSLELQAPTGEAEVFVIGGGGAGIPIYRQLQRSGKAFRCGILWENDIEYPVAKALAQSVIAVPAFQEISEADYEQAIEQMKMCKSVLCGLTPQQLQGLGAYNGKLLEQAKDLGLLHL